MQYDPGKQGIKGCKADDWHTAHMGDINIIHTEDDRIVFVCTNWTQKQQGPENLFISVFIFQA